MTMLILLLYTCTEIHANFFSDLMMVPDSCIKKKVSPSEVQILKFVLCNSFYKTNNLNILTHIHDINPLLHVLVL